MSVSTALTDLNIASYDIHTYYRKQPSLEKDKILKLRAKLEKDFAKEIEAGDIRVHKVHDEPIGPHPIPMWEIDFKKPEIFVRVVPWYQIHHDGLPVLIHPKTNKGELIDHTEHALWIGYPQDLILDILK